jgi:hypothetical protein
MKMAGSPLPPTLALMLLLHLLLLLSIGKKRVSAIISEIELLLIPLLGLRRTGLRPFSAKRWIHETIQIPVAPFVAVAALLYGWIIAAGQPKIRKQF